MIINNYPLIFQTAKIGIFVRFRFRKKEDVFYISLTGCLYPSNQYYKKLKTCCSIVTKRSEQNIFSIVLELLK